MSSIEHHSQDLLPLHVKRKSTHEISDEVIARKPEFLDAIILCMHMAPVDRKVIPVELEIDNAQWSRIINGQAHFPPNKLSKLMDICGNEVPLRWLAMHRGYGLVRLQSELEKENEDLKLQILEQSKKLEHMKEFMTLVKP